MTARADETTTIARDGRAVPVEIFRPAADAGPPPWPAVVVIHEIFGVNDDGMHIACVLRAMQALRAGRGPQVDDLEALLDALAARPDVARIGAAGFCMGGGFALLLGTRARVDVAGVFYGDTRPRDELARVCPVTGGYGGLDRLYGSTGRELVATLDALGKEHDIRIYEDAGHSYMSDAGHPVLAWLARPLMHVEYNAAAAEDSWRRMLAFFARHLRATGAHATPPPEER